MKQKLTYLILILAVLGSCALFLTYHTYGNIEFALALRLKKFWALSLLVSHVVLQQSAFKP